MVFDLFNYFTILLLISAVKMVHIKCRSTTYLFANITRYLLTDTQVPWSIPLENYNPPEYNSPNLKNKPWADPDIYDVNFKPKWNELDCKINRKSHTGFYTIQDKRPLNPEGRTGLKGRGVLGKWGPNHAADPIVTRWKIQNNKQIIHVTSNLPILQFCAIQRKDCDEWAIPGGMVDPGEQITETLRREFLEEAFNSLGNTSNPNQLKEAENLIKEFFKNGREIYKGYVDDPRNTDNAWMETIAVNFHDKTGKVVGKFDLQAGDDAKNVIWVDIDRNLKLYASHADFIKSVAEMHKAHW